MGENNISGSPNQSNGGHQQSPSPPTGSTGQSPQYTAEYLAQLLKDKKQLAAFPNIFLHLERLIDEEIGKVRISLFQFEFSKDALVLPEPIGPIQTVQEKVYVPIQDHPDYNFVGRILGPRGMTAKQLEQETGCKIMVRGRGSMRDKKKEELNRGKPNWEHLNEELHVLVQCEDTEERAKIKLQRAVEEIRKLLVPAAEGEDELKRKQLMELAIINGTYRPANQSRVGLQTPRLLTPMTLPSPLRSPTLGAPIILSPNRGPACTLANGLITPNGSIPSGYIPSSPTEIQGSPGVFINYGSFAPGYDPSVAAAYPYLASPLLAGDYPGGFDLNQVGQLLARH